MFFTPKGAHPSAVGEVGAIPKITRLRSCRERSPNTMSWEDFHSKEIEKEYFPKLQQKVDYWYYDEVKFFTEVYPPKELIYRCFEETPFDKVRVVILGQDPYHQKGQANGLAFAINDGNRIPPSLKNIIKESCCTDTTRVKWARQGVLLLNTTLTVKESKPQSCSGVGWETYTDNAIKYLLDRSNSDNPIIFCLWGNSAMAKESIIREFDVTVLTSSHPSPLSCGSTSQPFNGCDHFAKINEVLESKGQPIIIW